MTRFSITDETGSAERISITDTKFFHIGSGAGTERLTVAGTRFAEANGIIASKRITPAGASPTTGSVSIGVGAKATVNTTSGRRPVFSYENLTSTERPEGSGDFFPDIVVSSMSTSSFELQNIGDFPETVKYAFV